MKLRGYLYVCCLVALNLQCSSKKENSDQQNREQSAKQLVHKGFSIWEIFYGSDYKQMLYGKVKFSEELMYEMNKDASGKYVKSRKKYYNSWLLNGAFPWNMKVEFDTLGRLYRSSSYRVAADKHNDYSKYGIEYVYNEKNQLYRIKNLKSDFHGFYSTDGYKMIYDKDGTVKYRLWINHDDDDMWTEDSLVFKYNKHGDIENSKKYEVLEGREPLVLEEDYGKPTKYQYDNKGRVTKSSKEGGSANRFYYESDHLVKRVETIGSRTSEYTYYPTGVVKFARLRTTMIPGDVKFNETGEVTHFNGQKVADFSEYDEHGNWRVRISYDDHGIPETYTDRVIEYYE